MKRFAIPAISLAALMASGVAFAETAQQPATQPSQQMEQKKQPATPAPTTAPDPSKSSVQQKTDTTVQPTAPADTTVQTTAPADTSTTAATKTTAPADTSSATANSVSVDASKAVLATKFIGSSVYTAANENIGDINDIIFDDKGTIKAVIIGVGGFLGMGEKDVAMPLDKITIVKDENNAVKLTVQASKDDLEKAPAFDKTLFVVKSPAPSGSSSTTTQQ